MFIIYIFLFFLFMNFLWEVLRTLATRSAAKVPVAEVTSVASATENKRKLVYLSQSRPVMTEDYYTEARVVTHQHSSDPAIVPHLKTF